MSTSTIARDEQKEVIILGVDPGYDRCGFALISKNPGVRERLLYSHCFTTSAKLPFAERLLLVGAEYERLLALYTPQICALEKVYFTSNQKTAMHVAEVRGVLIYLTVRTKTVLCEYGPNEVKVAIAGDGGASKRQVMDMIPRLIAIPEGIQYDDEYDAIAVALTASACSTGYTKAL
jgi:crossover junction endodeoxyribonuclease RuvC